MGEQTRMYFEVFDRGIEREESTHKIAELINDVEISNNRLLLII